MIGRARSSSSSPSEKFLTFGRQSVWLSIHSRRRSANCGRSRKRWFVSRNSGTDPSILERGLDQVDRVELVAAVVALVAARLGVAADRARALDVAVRERVPGRRGERDEHLALDDRAVVVQRPEEILHDALVVERRRAREQVVREPEPAEVLAERLVVVVGDLTVRLPFSIRDDHHRRAVLVRPADHEHVVPLEPVVAGEDVRRDAEARDVAQVPWPAAYGHAGATRIFFAPTRHRGQ